MTDVRSAAINIVGLDLVDVQANDGHSRPRELKRQGKPNIAKANDGDFIE